MRDLSKPLAPTFGGGNGKAKRDRKKAEHNAKASDKHHNKRKAKIDKLKTTNPKRADRMIKKSSKRRSPKI
jgi:hypothetical protein